MIRLRYWSAKRAGAGMIVRGKHAASGVPVMLFPVDLIWVQEGSIFASIGGETAAELLP